MNQARAITLLSQAMPVTEDMLHSQIVQYCALTLPRGAVLHHSPNEGRRGWKSQRWLKSSGVQSGWPDIEIFYRGGVLFMEVKSAKGRLQPSQSNVHERLADADFPVVVVHDFESAKEAVGHFIKSRWP